VDGQGFNTFGSYVPNASGNQVTFEPLAGGLALGTDYAVSLTGGIVNGAGVPLLPFNSTFSTADGTFGAGGQLRYGNQTGNFALGANYFGSLIAVVDIYLGGVDFGLLVGVYDAGTSLTAPTFFLQDTPGQEVNYPSAALAPDGTAFVAWTTQPTDAGVQLPYYTALVSPYQPTFHSWGPILVLADGGPVPQTPQAVAFNADNGTDGLVAWLGSNGTKQLVQGIYHGSGGWGNAGTIQTDTSASASNLGASADFQGNVLVTWQSLPETGPSEIIGAYLGIDGTLPPPVAVSDPDVLSVNPWSALGITGLGAVTWAVLSAESDGGTASHVFASTFDPQHNPSFSTPVQLDQSVFFADFPQVGVSANGNAVAVWQEPGQIMAAVYTKASGTWSSPQVLDSDPVRLLNGPAVVVDPGGNAVANWVKVTPDAGYQLFGGRYTADGGWHGQQQLTTGVDPVPDIQPGMVIDAQGRTFTITTRLPPDSQYLQYIPFQ
jgi:hypothetical protein